MRRFVGLFVGMVFLSVMGMACDDSLPSIPFDAAATDGAKTDGAKTDGAKTDGAKTDSLGDITGLDINVDECLAKADGTVCGPDSKSICLNKACVTSSCGDGYVDAVEGEECEDDNVVDGDGCTQCHWDCKVAKDCDDGSLCNGTETCDATKHVCMAGTPAAANTACTLTGGGAGICNGGQCVKTGCGNSTKESGEDCDDGNQVAGDGCENDCTWTCQANADCDDKDPCNGTETCDKTVATKPVCQTGMPIKCPKGISGCQGTCESATGKCTYADADKDGVTCETDCNDADPGIFPGAFECKDGKDNDCNPKTLDSSAPACICYVDNDSDGYAHTKTGSLTAVTCPAKYTHREPASSTTTDCNDGKADVNPGQKNYFTKRYCAQYFLWIPGQPHVCKTYSWDYNCNGKDDMQYTHIFSKCYMSGIRCGGAGWSKTLPACGQTGSYISCTYFLGMCSSSLKPSTRTQACH